MRGTTFPWRGLGMTTTRSRGECDGTGLDVMGWMVVCRRSMIKYFWQQEQCLATACVFAGGLQMAKAEANK